MVSAKNVLELITPRAESLLGDLLGMGFGELAALQETSVEDLPGYPKPAALSTYRSVLPDGEVQIVVQLAVSGILGTARFWVEGFRISPEGVPQRMKPEDLYDYH
jgi:hypothetical protein